MRSGDAKHFGNRHDARHVERLARDRRGRASIDHYEAAASRVVLTDKSEPGGCVLVPFHNHVLQQVAKAGFHGSLVASVDLDVIRDRPLLAHLSIGLDEHHPRGVAKFRTA